MAPASNRTVRVREDLLVNAQTLAPLATISAVVNDALREWIEKRKPKASDDRQT